MCTVYTWPWIHPRYSHLDHSLRLGTFQSYLPPRHCFHRPNPCRAHSKLHPNLHRRHQGVARAPTTAKIRLSYPSSLRISRVKHLSLPSVLPPIWHCPRAALHPHRCARRHTASRSAQNSSLSRSPAFLDVALPSGVIRMLVAFAVIVLDVTLHRDPPRISRYHVLLLPSTSLELTAHYVYFPTLPSGCSTLHSSPSPFPKQHALYSPQTSLSNMSTSLRRPCTAPHDSHTRWRRHCQARRCTAQDCPKALIPPPLDVLAPRSTPRTLAGTVIVQLKVALHQDGLKSVVRRPSRFSGHSSSSLNTSNPPHPRRRCARRRCPSKSG
ncbi:hypothetical protein C8F01DRAFT_46461 [Mycena amicta]|nr:hypothetical protein C8F01DRAFT_46461 [Mycena amicta]